MSRPNFKRYFPRKEESSDEGEWQQVTRRPQISQPKKVQPQELQPATTQQPGHVSQTQEQSQSSGRAHNPYPQAIGFASEAASDGELNAGLPERLAFRPAPYLAQQFQSMDRRADLLEIEGVRKYVREADAPLDASASHWRHQSEVPTSDEFVRELDAVINFKVPALANKIDGPYLSRDHYLGTHYRLLREDALLPLREAVGLVRKHPYANEARISSTSGIYTNVHITGLTLANRGVAVRVVFSLARLGKRVNWEQSKRLISGSLVALTPEKDMFQTKCIMAVVAARPLKDLQDPERPPGVHLFFPRANEIEIDTSESWVMVESRSTFFEAYRHTLCALQKLMLEPFPLAEYLVDVQQVIDAPDYVQANPVADLSSVFHPTTHKSYNKVNVLRRWPEPKASSTELDRSQSEALQRMLTKRLAIVQGPPGTGKTHISVCALKILLDSANWKIGDPPIIVTCQTNHALDQLLRHVAEFEKSFARLGGRTKDFEVVKPRTIYELKQAEKKYPIAAGYKGPARRQMNELEKKMQLLLAPLNPESGLLPPALLRDFGLITGQQCVSLQNPDTGYTRHGGHDEGLSAMAEWLGGELVSAKREIPLDNFGIDYEEPDLEFEQLKEIEAENAVADDEDAERLFGARVQLGDGYVGKLTSRSRRCDDTAILKLLQKQNLGQIHPNFRGAVYNYLLRQVKSKILAQFRILNAKYQEASKKFMIGRWEEELLILKTQKVIGMTATGFSKYRALVSALKPKIVMLEEAAEALEAPVTATCVPSLEHLILVGDHKQLRPNCNDRRYQDSPVFLNMSLFERMVTNHVEYTTLRQQRRMKPEIRELLQPIYKDMIIDHPSVTTNRPQVPGMGPNSFFFTHRWPETQDAYLSVCNEKEAEMVAGFVYFLYLNGVAADEITVLTFYNGQRKNILRRLRSNPSMKDLRFKVVTVDSYQGEENEIVMLSTVRNENGATIGFLKSDNRVCVALSRARRGFYLFGNSIRLSEESDTWESVINIMKESERLGESLPLYCDQHDQTVLIQDPSDWKQLAGGCAEMCEAPLPCGHVCPLRCHPYPHEAKACTQPCLTVLPCGHQCVQCCCDPCSCPCGAPAVRKGAMELEDSGRLTGRLSDRLVGLAPARAVREKVTKPEHSSRLPERPTGRHPDRPVGLTPARDISQDTDRADSGLESDESSWNLFASGGHRQHDQELNRQLRDKKNLEDPIASVSSINPPSSPTSTVRPMGPGRNVYEDTFRPSATPSPAAIDARDNGGHDQYDQELDRQFRAKLGLDDTFAPTSSIKPPASTTSTVRPMGPGRNVYEDTFRPSATPSSAAIAARDNGGHDQDDQELDRQFRAKLGLDDTFASISSINPPASTTSTVRPMGPGRNVYEDTFRPSATPPPAAIAARYNGRPYHANSHQNAAAGSPLGRRPPVNTVVGPDGPATKKAEPKSYTHSQNYMATGAGSASPAPRARINPEFMKDDPFATRRLPAAQSTAQINPNFMHNDDPFAPRRLPAAQSTAQMTQASTAPHARINPQFSQNDLFEPRRAPAAQTASQMAQMIRSSGNVYSDAYRSNNTGSNNNHQNRNNNTNNDNNNNGQAKKSNNNISLLDL